MSRCIVSLIGLILLVGCCGVCAAGTGSDSAEYPPDDPAYYPTFTMEPAPIGGDSGWVHIDSAPQGAWVNFDGSDEGTTPVDVRVFSTGSPFHTIRVTKEGYQDWSAELSQNPGSGQTLYQFANLVAIQPTFTVEPTSIGGDFGWVHIDSTPQGARVYFDGSDEGTTPVNVRVFSTGSPFHTIRVTKEGYQDWSAELSRNPLSGETMYQYANLVAIQPTITVEPTLIGGDAGWFKIDTVPQGADVYFDETYYGTSPVLVKVMATATPSHDIRITMNGYRDYAQHLSYNPGRDQTVPLSIPLSPLARYGSISVGSNPSGALATLDSGPQYLTPCTFTGVLPGTHTITVSKSGYRTYTQQVVLSYGSQSVYAQLAEKQPTGTLYVDSSPQGADVKVDNTWQGETPQRIGNLASGYHTVKLQLSGYQTITQEVMITTGQEIQINPELIKNPPEVKTGSISVSSNPAGASVYLNNDYQGITPSSGYLDLTDLTPGVYTILLREPQHEDYSTSITVTAGKITPVHGELKAPATPSAINGTLSIRSSPSGAQVFLDNRLVGITPVSISTVVPGQFGLILKMDGYADYTNQVQIAAGMTTSASITLVPLVTASPTASPSSVPSSVPAETRTPLPWFLVPAGLCAALLMIRRDR
jgi:hypothetical protein